MSRLDSLLPKRRRLAVLLSLGLSGLVAGCNTTDAPGQPLTASLVEPAPTAAVDTGVAAGAAAPAVATATRPTAAADPLEYRLAPLDVIEVTVFKVPDLSKTVAIDGSGRIDLPLIGAITASGKTVRQLEQEVSTKLAAKYLQSPQVGVFVKEYASQRITIEGAVNKPGIYEIKGGASLLQAVAMAGGFQRSASTSRIVVFRGSGPQRQAAVFDMKAIRAGRKPDPTIVAGDVIVVDESVVKSTLRDLREVLGVFMMTPFL